MNVFEGRRRLLCVYFLYFLVFGILGFKLIFDEVVRFIRIFEINSLVLFFR